MNITHTIVLSLSIAACLVTGARADDDVVLDALVDELGRSMTIQLEDLESPYFVQYAVDDNESYRIAATCGGIVSSDDSRARRLATNLRVGYYDLDNTNFAGGGRGGMRFGRGRGRGGGGGAAMLPTEDSYTAIRQATWLSTDSAYKQAVETLARKKAYMEDRNLQDRPDDFARAEPVVSIDPKVALALEVDVWERRLQELSARFLEYPHVLDSQVTLTASADNRYIVNSEGTRIRKGIEGVVLAISAEAQADDGERLSDRVTFHAASAAALPPEDELMAVVDAMAERLTGRVTAGILDNYLGPVLFDDRAAPQVFQAVLARGVAGRTEPVGAGRRRTATTESLDKYLGKRILPRGFNVYDDPRIKRIGDRYVAGHYRIDDEGVEAQRVDIVVDGRLQGMVMSRVPTRDFAESTGHGRSAGAGGARAAVGCLVVESDSGLTDAELRQALIEEVENQDLEYGLRVTSISGGGGQAAAIQRMMAQLRGGGGGGTPSALGDPIAVYKVYPDGHEELVRGCEFGSIDVGTLKDILAAGKTPIVHNTGSAAGAAASIVAPAVLFEEVELFTIEEERQTTPIVDAPHQRKASSNRG